MVSSAITPAVILCVIHRVIWSLLLGGPRGKRRPIIFLREAHFYITHFPFRHVIGGLRAVQAAANHHRTRVIIIIIFRWLRGRETLCCFTNPWQQPTFLSISRWTFKYTTTTNDVIVVECPVRWILIRVEGGGCPVTSSSWRSLGF